MWFLTVAVNASRIDRSLNRVNGVIWIQILKYTNLTRCYDTFLVIHDKWFTRNQLFIHLLFKDKDKKPLSALTYSYIYLPGKGLAEITGQNKLWNKLFKVLPCWSEQLWWCRQYDSNLSITLHDKESLVIGEVTFRGCAVWLQLFFLYEKVSLTLTLSYIPPK